MLLLFLGLNFNTLTIRVNRLQKSSKRIIFCRQVRTCLVLHLGGRWNPLTTRWFIGLNRKKRIKAHRPFISFFSSRNRNTIAVIALLGNCPQSTREKIYLIFHQCCKRLTAINIVLNAPASRSYAMDTPSWIIILLAKECE